MSHYQSLTCVYVSNNPSTTYFAFTDTYFVKCGNMLDRSKHFAADRSFHLFLNTKKSIGI